MASADILENLEFSQNGPVKTPVEERENHSIFRIALSKGLIVPPHMGGHVAFFLVLKGKGIFTCGDREVELGPNEYIQIENEDARGIQALEDLVVLAVRD